MDFALVKNGYNKNDVDKYISNIEQVISEKDAIIADLSRQLNEYKLNENNIKEKDENISIALTAAVEKAKQIEKSSQNVYKLKIQQLEILYSRWQNLLNEFVKKYPNLQETKNIKEVMNDFKKAIKTTIKNDFNFTSIDSPLTSDNDSIRTLLSKMKSCIRDQQNPAKEVTRDRKPLSKDLQETQSELRRIEEKAPLIRPIYKGETSSEDNLLDQFLSENDTTSSNYANIITSKNVSAPKVNETGFDLEEAVNPKEDLEEIMKSFDFFNNGGNKTNK